jgi:hypothetical protein
MREQDAWLGELYQAYACALEEAGRALADWWSAPRVMKRDAFTVYRAAADREDAAAFAWLRACAAFDAAGASSARP